MQAAGARRRWIMPAPFAQPVILGLRPFQPKTGVAVLGVVSVVRMAREASLKREEDKAAKAAGMAEMSRPAGRCSPITPVEATSTCSASIPAMRVKARAVLRAAASPRSPVAAFAHPEFATIARAAPPVFMREAELRRTGAAVKRFVVNSAAAEAGRSEKNRARSRSGFLAAPARFARLMPHETPAARNPRGSGGGFTAPGPSLPRRSLNARRARSEERRVGKECGDRWVR